MRLLLYIDDKLADLGTGASESLVLWTYTRDDADAPAAVKNSYTKTITLPATDANDRIFTHAGALDRVTIAGTFDTLERTPFSIMGEDGQLLDRGYLKLDKIARRGEVVLSYDVTLYGGMGGFFYALGYKSDGSKRTLADIRWLEDTLSPLVSHLEDPHYIPISYPDVAWADLLDGSYKTKTTGVVNFVPAQNGIPDSSQFDAGKAYYKPGDTWRKKLDGLPVFQGVNGVTYGPRSTDNGGIFVNLGGQFTEWETQCFAPTQQRCAFSLARLFRSIEAGCNAGDFGGDWTLVFDSDFFNNNNPYFADAWVTLEATVPEWAAHADQVLRTTKTPADYLLGYAKTFGLVFVVDNATQTITITTRNKYYNTGLSVIDLSDRVAADVRVRPNLMTARTYTFGVPMAGAFAETYAANRGRAYGDFIVDSGAVFSAESIDVLQSSPFNGVVDVLESSPWYITKPDRSDDPPPRGNYVKFVEYGEVSYQLYANGDASSTKITAASECGRSSYASQMAALPQFHDASGKRIKGADVLLFLAGRFTLPTGTSAAPAYWHLGEKNLDGVKKTYDISPWEGVIQITELPLFRRSIDARGFGYLPPVGQGTLGLDFGDPLQIATGEGTIPDGTIYPDYWQKYIEDRFDRDAMVLEARVDLAGLDACPSLLRRFFWYRGSVWSLNKITDFNPARPGITLCEFVRVKDTTNYTAGQRLPDYYR